jgi:hypothetical protein
MLPTAHKSGERFSVQTDQRRRWRQARIPKPGRCSVSSALPHIASQQAEGARRAFQRGHLRTASEDVYLYGSAALLGTPAHRKRAAKESTAHRQARMNSRNLSNIATLFTHRQPWFAASHGRRWVRTEGTAVDGRRAVRKAVRGEIPDFVRDFACARGRPQSGSTC